jgi:uncharacterized protein (TIGR02231 family)
MKFFPPFALFIALLFTSLVQSQELKVVELPIQEVTVFLNQAQVSRSGELVLPSGKVNVQIKGITSRINPNSIIVEGNAAYTILGVKHEQLFDEAANMSKSLKSKLDSLDDVNFEISTKTALEGVYNDEMAFLTENRSVKGDEAVMLVEDLEEMANFRRERVKEVQFRLIEVRMEQNELRKTASRLQQEINKLSGNQRQNQSAITISLNVNQSGKSKLSFSYMVYDASWVPLYDIRAKSTSEDVVLSYKGKVRQATGNDWNNVKLTLSSGNPAIGGNPPSLYPWQLRLQEFYGANKAKARADNNYAEPMATYDLEESQGILGKPAVMEVQMVENVTSTEFQIAVPYSVPSDNQFVEVENQRFSLPSSYSHFSVPKLNQSAYLRCGVSDWMGYNLLPGNASIYFQGTFTGTSFIDANSGEDTLQLSLGRDPGVIVKYDKIKEFCKTNTFGGKKVTTKAFEINISNNKSTAITILVEDQIPLSQNGDIEVTVEELSGGTLDPETGKVTWEVELAAGQSMKKTLRFAVKYPKKKQVSGL